MQKNKILLWIATIFLAFLAYFLLPEGCPEAAKRVVAILIIAASSWSFELFPSFVTSILVILLLILSLSLGGLINYEVFLSPFANPVIILFLGGFMLASALRKYKVDAYLGSHLLPRFGKKPYLVLLGILFVTGFISMWISNTVTSVIMLALLHPCFEHEHLDAPFKKAMVLAVPFGANVGGLATPIGSPPNAIALAFLKEEHISFSFIEWMVLFVPLVIFLLFIISVILHYLFPTNLISVDLSLKKENLTSSGKQVLGLFVSAILLIVTSPLHGIPESVCALMGAFALCATGFIGKEEIKKLNWDILILLWGGLALGIASEKSGLVDWLLNIGLLNFSSVSLAILCTFLAYILTVFMSNTAAAALVMPIAFAIPGINKIMITIMVISACSVGMILPISTPPNAIAYSTGFITTKDMVKSGILIDVTALVMMLIGFYVISSVIGF